MKIELLAPAGNTNIARSAILSGADAVYIGGPAFGARTAAGNSLDEIGELTRFAHSYGAKVYLTMNTILMDNELEQAQRQADKAWQIGVDALIVQDLAYLAMQLPPIELHSSTQMFNRSVERVQMHEKLGFARVVLERGLTINEIRDIRAKTSVELEAFIHGAICVGYSGQCYLSHALCGRGGNRGGCAQSCRSSFDLKRTSGELIAKQKQLLSVGDMNLSDRLSAIIEAGVCSLKIEGRLKDESYVVNNVAYYNDALRDLGVERVAGGVCKKKFVPNPLKSFSRPFTHYFFDNKRAKVSAPSKSLGEYLGRVKSIKGQSIIVSTELVVNNGDGLCWMDGTGNVIGTNVNTSGDGKIILNKLVPEVGMEIYRNSDRSFSPSSKDVDKRIEARIIFSAESIVAKDINGYEVTLDINMTDFEQARSVDVALRGIREAMCKSGDTIFDVVEVDVCVEQMKFVPRSVLNGWRNEVLNKLLAKRLDEYTRRERISVKREQLVDYEVDFRANLSNRLSVEVSESIGARVLERALECGGDTIGREVMRTRYCIRRELCICPKENKGETSQMLILENNGKKIEAHFECDVCEMSLVYLG